MAIITFGNLIATSGENPNVWMLQQLQKQNGEHKSV